VAENPTIIGHEFCGEIVRVGSRWAEDFKPGDRFIIQPALGYKGSLDAPGYSFRYIGGDATYVIIPHEVMDMNCLIPYKGKDFFAGSLSEPYSCVIGTMHAMYHTTYGSYVHKMGIVEGGKMAMLAGNGPMGQAAIDYVIHCDRRPSLLVVTGRRQEQLDRLARLLTVEDAAANGVELHYFNTSACPNAYGSLMELSGGTGYDDVIVFTPVASMVELGDDLLGKDGCLNFFSGPNDKNFKALFNFYNVHYGSTHIVGTSGGNTEDMREAVSMMADGKLTPAILISHVGGLDAVPEATLHLPEIPGGKKLIYTEIEMPLTAIADFEKLGKDNPFYARLHELCAAHNGLWNTDAEEYLLKTKSV
jgi:threonine dehydrogenase-like Zn-dependent dehydrogenase